MPVRDLHLFLIGAFACVGAAIAAVSLGAYGVVPFAVIAAGLFGLGVADAAKSPRVLLVGPSGTRGMPALETVLSAAGCSLTRCEGPNVNDCPALAGGDCPYAGHLMGAVVVEEPGGIAGPCGEALRVRELRLQGARLSDPLGRIDLLKSAKRFARA